MRKLFVLGFLLAAGIFFGGVYYTGFIVGKVSTGELMVGIDGGVVVVYNSFEGQGDTTDLFHMNDSELSKIVGLSLEDVENGKIYFPGETNLLSDTVNNTIDIDSNVKILHNYLSINPNKLSSLNRSAIINFYGITFKEPVILKNGVECSSSECNKLSYVSSEFIFNVTSAGNYSLKEGYVAPVDDGSSGSGSSAEDTSSGGSGSSAPLYEITQDFVTTSLFPGNNKTELLKIENLGNQQIVLEVKPSFILSNFLYFENNRIVIEPGKTLYYPLVFYSRVETKPDVYVGKLTISGAGSTKDLDVLVEVLERKPIFDVFVNTSEKISLGKDISSKIDLINMGTLQGFDVLLYYSIKDFSGNVISYKEESLFIKDRLSLERELSFPNYKTGRYVFYVNVSYGDIYAVGSDSFVVVENKYFILLIILIVVLIGLIIYLLWPNIKESKLYKKYFVKEKKKDFSYFGQRF